MASCDTDDDVILIAAVLSGAFGNECKKKLISANEAFGLIDG